MTQQMIEAAEQEQWEQVVALYRQRDPLLRVFFSQAELSEEAEFLRQAIPELEALEERLRLHCANARDEAAKHLGRFSLGRKAHAAYQKNR